MKDLDQNELLYVLCLSRTRSIAAAARKLGVDYSTLRRRISVIESQLGVRLFQRKAGILTPTDTGKIFVLRAESIELDADAVKHSVTAARQP